MPPLAIVIILVPLVAALLPQFIHRNANTKKSFSILYNWIIIILLGIFAGSILVFPELLLLNRDTYFFGGLMVPTLSIVGGLIFSLVGLIVEIWETKKQELGFSQVLWSTSFLGFLGLVVLAISVITSLSAGNAL